MPSFLHKALSCIFAICLLGSLSCDRRTNPNPNPTPNPTPEQNSWPTPPQSDFYVLDAVTLVEASSNTHLEAARVVVRDGRIDSVGLAEDVAIPEGAEVVRLNGAFVTPGLIDSHVHLGALAADHGQSRGGPDDVEPEAPTEKIVELSQVLLDAGITSLKSVGDPFEWILETRMALQNEAPHSPRLFVAGPLFTAPGGHPSATIWEANAWLREEASVEVETPQEARAVVEEVARLKVDLIKVVFDDGGGRFASLDREVLQAIVESAEEWELPVTVHIGDGADARTAVASGAAGLEHARPITEETLAQMAAEEVYFVPTLAVFEALQGAVPQEVNESVALALASGVPIVAGSDLGNPGLEPGESLHRELQLLIAAGLSAHQALEAATTTPARFLGREDELGTLREGAFADLLLLDEDPLQDIAALATPRWVIRSGTVVAEH